MKKYIAFLFTLAFIFSFNTNLVGATTLYNEDDYNDSGCVAGAKFNVKTGKACVVTSVVDCAPGHLFSAFTGKPCTLEKEEVPKQICTYPMNTELKFGSRGEKVKEFQQTLKDFGFMSGKVDGVYGKITESARQNYYKKCPMPPKDSGSVVISGVSGPQSLKAGETGTWTVKAYDKNGGDLFYSVNWGDVYSTDVLKGNSLIQSQSESQSATFTYSYLTAGKYTPKFTVTSENTIRCFKAPCPSNGGSATTSLSVKVGETTENKVGYLSIEPENISIRLGDGNTPVRAYYQPPMPDCPAGAMCAQVMPALREVDATWNVHNSNIAELRYTTCAVLGGCGTGVSLGGVSEGTTKLTATYKISGVKLTATAKVTVTEDVIAVCDYANPPEGCNYVPGPNYNSKTQCGLVLNCYQTTN